jgi:inosine-uridine nucleoside N-ribohydrolase
MIDVVWDMETGDPDDFLTLLLLLGYPQVNLKAVAVTPGTPDQVGVVRRALEWFGRDIPVGAHNLDHQPRSVREQGDPGEGRHGPRGVCVSSWHYKAYGDIPSSRDAAPGGEVLHAHCDESTTLVTGAPLKNLGAAMRLPNFRVGRLVVQGGFAGEGVVPPERQLDKFRGLVTCPTYNLNGDPRSAEAALVHPGIGVRRFVSKNVCHGVYYDAGMHSAVTAVKHRSPSLQRIWQGMEVYLDKSPEGKKFHDPLAACCAIDEAIGEWAEVELFRARGGWGSRPSPGSNTWIITGYDHDRFVRTLLASGAEPAV